MKFSLSYLRKEIGGICLNIPNSRNLFNIHGSWGDAKNRVKSYFEKSFQQAPMIGKCATILGLEINNQESFTNL